MGQSAPAKLAPADVRERVKGLRLDDVLGDQTLLKQATSGSTCAYQCYRFVPVSSRNGERVSYIAGVKFWHLGSEVSLESATAEGPDDPSQGVLSGEGEDHAFRWDGDEEGRHHALVIRFEKATAVTEFAFRTSYNESRERDPVRFKLEGSSSGRSWLTLCDQTETDFTTPNLRGSWTQKMPLRDMTVSPDHVEMRAARNLASVMERRGVEDLALWASDKPPRAPVDEAAALVECCRVQLMGEEQRRREELFSMIYAANEAAVVAAQEAESRSARQAQSKPAEVGSGIAALTARCAVHLILESQLQGAQSGLALDLLNRHLMDGIVNLRLPPKAGDIPEALSAALTAAAEICRNALSSRFDGMEPALAGSPAATAKALRGKHEQGPKVAQLLLRLAALRGSFGDALVVARWLLCEQPDGDLSSICPALKVLDEIHAAWQMEAFKEGTWTADDVPSRKAVRSKACLTPAQLQSCGNEGVYAEAHVIVGTDCRVGFLPCSAKSPDDAGVGFQAGKAYLEGDLRPMEGQQNSRSIKNGDTVGLWLRWGHGVEVFVNGSTWGQLPRCRELETSGCFFVVASLSKEDEVALNVGQQPFRYRSPDDSVSIAKAAGVDCLDIDKLASASSSSDSIAEALLSILLRNAALVPDDSAAGSAEAKNYESKHPYDNYADEFVEVHIPGARSLKIVFSPRCQTETGCDFLRFWADATRSKQIGKDCHGREFANLEIEGDRFWYHFTSDSSQVEWGFKFSVEPEMPPRENEFPLCLEPTIDTVTTLIDILQHPRIVSLPKASAAVLNMLAKHVNRISNMPAQVQRDAADLLLRLAREQSEVGAISAHVFGDCCNALFQQPVQLMRAQLRIWKEPHEYHPDAVTIVSEKIAGANSPVGCIVDDTAASAVFDEFAAAVAGEASIVGHPAPAARLLWRTLSESVSYLIADRSRCGLDGWALVLKVVKRIFELGAATAGALSATPLENPPGFLRSLLLPLLYGMASVPSLQEAPWDAVVTLIPPIGILARTCGAADAPAVLRDLQSAALALLAKLGRAIIGEGRLVKSDEANAEVLLSPLLCIVPCGALGKDYGGPPTGVFMVEQVTGTKLQSAEDASGESINPLIAEVVDLASDRAKGAVESLKDAASSGRAFSGRAFFPDRIRRLLFCILVKQFRALDSLQLLLESSGGGDPASKNIVQNLWTQAQRLEPWLLSVKQRQVVGGREGSSVVEAMEQTLELLVRCNQTVELDGALHGEDDGLEALWARQMPLIGGKPHTPKSPSLRWSSQTDEPPPLQRLHSLLQEVPLPGANVPAQQVKTFFEGKWFTKSSPLAALIRGIQDVSLAVWRRAAGLSLLAWAAEQCADSVEGWAVGSVISALCESWREEALLQRRCAEASSVMALALSRQQAVKAMTRLAQGSLQGEQGQVLQVMALAGLAGPWRGDDHDILLGAEVMSTLRPHLPWARESIVSANKQRGRASWLAFESISATLAPATEQAVSAGSSLVLEEVFRMMEQALPEVIGKGKPPEPKEGEGRPSEGEAGATGEAMSLLRMFGAKVVRTSGQSGENSGSPTRGPHLSEIIADLRRRLQAGEDFGGLESEPDRWSAWLDRLPRMLEPWESNRGRRTIAELEADGDSSDSEDGRTLQWTSHDVDGDGSIDMYEVLRVLQGVARRHSEEEEFRNWPSRYPAGLPRFFGDISLQANGASSKSTPLDLVPSPVCLSNPGCALLKSIDGLLRAQPSGAQATPCSDDFLEALLQAATDPNVALPIALLALRLLRNIQLPSAERETAATRKMIQALSTSTAGGGGPLYARGTAATLAAQRAEVLRAWVSTGRAVADALTEALSDPIQAAAVLYVVGAPPALSLLGSALAEGENHCLVVDAEFGGVTWTFHPNRDSPGNDIECHEDDRNPEVLKQRCLELGGVAFNTNGWIKSELRAEGEWDSFGGETDGMYVAKRDDSVAILRDGNSAVEEVAVASLQLLSRRCNMSKIGSALEKRIVDVALQQPCLEAWSLGAALAQPDAVLHFVAEGGMEKWLPLALDAPLKKLVAFSPADRSRITAALRMQFPGKYKDAVDACRTGADAAKCEPAAVSEKPEAEDPVVESTPRSDPDPVEEETESEDEEPGGRCDSGRHVCVLSDTCPRAYNSWVCNSCRSHRRGNRWFCQECSDDYCFDCRPLKLKKRNLKADQAERAKRKAALAAAGAAAVRRASRVLGEPDTLSMPASPEAGVPKLDALLAYAHAVLTHPPALRVLRLHALQDDGAGGTRSSASKSKCGLIDTTVQEEKKSSSSTKEIHKLLWAARSNEKELSELVVEAVAWDRQVLALEICLAVVLHFASCKEPLPEKLGQPLQLAQLCLAFESGLESVPERARARSALSSLTARLPTLLLATQELAFSHLLGGLGLQPSSSTSARTFESSHPYGNNESTSQEVSMPGASQIVISFDRRCSTEGGCDILRIHAGGASWQRDGEGPWTDIVVEQDNFKFTWYSDGSCTDWGYHFTATPDNCDEGDSDDKGTPSLAAGLMLLEFLVDMLEPSDSKALDFDARGLLRQEFAALLLAHVERSSTERLVVLLQRFIDGCRTQGIGLDWLNAQHALEAMTTAAQASGEQAVLQRCVGLRLSLPDVKVATDQPRFATTNRVLLLDEDRVCTARTRREAFCQVLAGTSTTLTFTRLTEKQTWIGVMYAVQASAQPSSVCMLSLTDGSSLINHAVGEPGPSLTSDSLREVRVLLDVYAGAVTFEGDSFSRVLNLPSIPDGNKGCWIFAAKLGEFGSSVRVTPPGGISNSSLQQLRATQDMLGALRGVGDSSLSDAFVIEAFSEWWSSCSPELRADVEDVDLDSLETSDLVVCRAGICKYNGKYKLDEPGSSSWTNEAGCKIFTVYCLGDAGQRQWWCMSEAAEVPMPAYAQLWPTDEGVESLPTDGPWLSLGKEAGEPPRVYSQEATSKFKVIQEFSPPLPSVLASAEGKTDAENPVAGKVSATQVIVTSRFTFIILLVDSEDCKPALLYTERDGEPKLVANSHCGCWGQAGCLVAPTSEWTECEGPALHFRGGPSHSIELLFRGTPGAAAGGRLAKLYPKLAVTAESVHPMPAGGQTSLKLSIPDAIGLTLQFSTRCQLPPDRVTLVSLDEAGQRPAVLKRRTGAVDPMLATSQPGMEQDAARGIIAVPKGQSFKLDAAECFLRFPLPRPVQWEPLALPVPVVEESAHPYGENLSISKKICLPGAQTLRVDFHTSCCTEGGYDNLRFYRDSDLELLVHSCSGEGPWEGFEFTHGNTLWFTFNSDEGNEHWGYHFTISDGGGDGGISPGIGLLEGIPNLFDDGVQLGGDGTLLFVGLTSPEVGNLRPVVTAKSEVTNFVIHEGYRYGTLDNVDPDAETEKGSQIEWYALPRGWLLVPNESALIEEVLAAHTWATDTLILEDGTAFGTKCFQEAGRAWRSQALETTVTMDGHRAFKPRSDLARILIRHPVESEACADDEGALPLPKDEASEGPDLGYVVRHSLSALNWLRPGVLAGELTIDFTGAPITSGDLALGITPGPCASLIWPSSEVADSPAAEAPVEKPIIPVTCDEGHPLDDLGTSMDNGWGCDGNKWPGGCKGGFTGFGQTTGVNRFRCLACDYDLCEKCYRYKKGLLSDEQQSEASPGIAPSWWWRCDGSQLSCGKPAGSDPAASFGAGDVVGVVASLEGSRLMKLAFLRNGITAVELSTDMELLDVDLGKLALCLALRRSSACASLLPSPKLIEQLPSSLADRVGQEDPLDEREQTVAVAVFKAMDVSADGALQREEIATALGGAREEVFHALDTLKDGKVSLDEWLLYCRRVKSVKGPNGIGLFLEAFRKKLVHIGRAVVVPEAEAQAIEAWGIEVTATPRELTTSGTLRAVQEGATSDWREFQALAIENWKYGLDSQVVALAEWLVQQLKSKDDESASDVSSPADLRSVHMQKFRGECRRAFPTLAESESRIISRLVILQQVNRWVKERVLPFCDLGDLRSSSFGRRVSQAREVLFGKVGRERFDQIVEETFTDAEGEMRLNRHLATACKTANECDSAGERMLFAQGSKLAETMSDQVFRSRGGEYGRPLRITYEDEEGVDQGGLYRDFLDACATELMSAQLPILMPTANATNNAGECREAWMVAPTPMTKSTKRMLNFLGRLMGICVRRGDVMPLSLSRTAWKLLVGDEPTLEDLLCDDVAAGESVRQLANIEAMDISAADFDLCFGEMFFVYNNSARVEVPLMEGGAQTRVTYDSAGKFAQLVQDMRLHEASEQIDCIRRGMASTVPIGCFSLWSWRELELRVCGNPEIDLKVLRKHTHYDGVNESDTHVQYLWQVLESFGQQDLQRFLRFCWGRSRLPPEGSPLWENGFKVANGSDISPTGLPRAHTCFFQIDLPKYPSKQQAEERILFAVRNCVDLQIA